MPIPPPKRGAPVAEWRAWYQQRTQEIVEQVPSNIMKVLKARAEYVAPFRRQARGPKGKFIKAPPAPPVAELIEPTIPRAMDSTAQALGGNFVQEGWYSSATDMHVDLTDVWSAMRAFEGSIPRGGRAQVMAQFIVYDPSTGEQQFGGWISLSHAVRSDVAWIQAQSKLRQLAQRYMRMVITMITAQEWPRNDNGKVAA